MSLGNLRRRKLRTALTILGVLIGITSIVVMLSLGFAQKASLESSIGSADSLTSIDIYGGYYDPRADANGKKLNDDAIQEISALPNCEYVVPVLETYVYLKSGVYESSLSIVGLPDFYLREMNFDLERGSFPVEKPEGELPLLIGGFVNYEFRNPKQQDSFRDFSMFMEDDDGEKKELPPPPVDMFTTPVFVIYDMDAYWSAQMGGEGAPPMPKKYLIQADAVLSHEMTDSNMRYGWNGITELEALKKQLNMVFKGKAWPGQPARKNGRSTGEIIYSRFIVRSDDLNHTQDLVEKLREMGYQANSNVEFIQKMMEESSRTQMFLGGIGGISLLVAAIGIANTMMMSIYERTREIGIYKVLGLEMRRIRDLFLMESALIGFFGGVIGAGLSYLLSFLINRFAGASFGMNMMYMPGTGENPPLSIIPPWLVVVAVAFGILIGTLSGLMPALRAMRLSPLEAIRTE